MVHEQLVSTKFLSPTISGSRLTTSVFCFILLKVDQGEPTRIFWGLDGS